jgi:hypothetical protein
MKSWHCESPDGSTFMEFSFHPGQAFGPPEVEPPAPSWLAAAAQKVLGDVWPPEGAPLVVRYRIENDLDDFGVVTFTRPDGRRFGFGVAEDASEADLLVALADGVQENLPKAGFGGSVEALAEASPICPGHSHAARPIVLGGTGWWSCPRDDRRIAPIGSLR